MHLNMQGLRATFTIWSMNLKGSLPAVMTLQMLAKRLQQTCCTAMQG